MKISTKGRYALMVMIDIAEQRSDDYIRLIDIAQRQQISEKYLESIISSLTKNGMLTAVRGKGGGYKLARNPREYSVGSILKATEGSLAPVSCLETKPNMCESAGECKMIKMWTGLDRVVDEYLEGVTLADLAFGDGDNNY